MRKILCTKCAEAFHMHPADELDGWKMRKVGINVKVPEDGSHKVTIICNGHVESETLLKEIICDFCNNEIPSGTIGVAVTMWMGDEPGPWEAIYSQ